MEKTRQTAENKQTFGSTGKFEIEKKTRQNAANKQTFVLTRKIEINDKARQEKLCFARKNEATFVVFIE